jgi:FK506-binding nuclear protein
VYDSEDDEDDEDYDLSPDEDELDLELDEDEEDELDDLENPRITEVESEEEAPKLVKADKKGKNKRSADDLESLDEIMAKSATKAAEPEKLSKKQQKKLKTNEGKAVESKPEELSTKGDKKVQFAKNLEQGPTGPAKNAEAKAADKGKATLGVKTIKGVKIDDKKLGSGPAAKKGDRVGMRYIGKLVDGKVFDCKLSESQHV